jgi:arylsulfatase
MLDRKILVLVAGLLVVQMSPAQAQNAADGPPGGLVYETDFGLLWAQHGQRWTAEDQDVAAKLAALRETHGKPPNIIHIMWDDTSLGEVGVPLFNRVKGFDTPRINEMAAEGMSFARMYTEVACTQSRTAALTGRLAVRSGMFKVSFPPEGAGLPGSEVTLAEVLGPAGYATAFFGKAHQGDVEESYMHNQGFDVASFSMYNQWPPIAWHREGENAGLTMGYTRNQWDKKYALGQFFRPYGWIMQIEGEKGGLAREWKEPTFDSYRESHDYNQGLAMQYIRDNAQGDKPFYMAYWPNIFDLTGQAWDEYTTSQTIWGESMQRLDRYVGEVMDELERLGIAENTLVIAMADNGPFKEIAPDGPYENIFRGGKGSFLEGGIRVPAFAWWPGMIAPNQFIGDMVHITDLFTTFARLGGAMENIPKDRVIDGIDQTALLLNGDTHGRRDFAHIYSGPHLAATIKQNIKRHWLGDRPGLVGNSMFDLYKDPREEHGLMAQYLWTWPTFDQMRYRHEKLIQKYPHTPLAHDVPFKGIENLREESKQLQARFEIDLDRPWDGRVSP